MQHLTADEINALLDNPLAAPFWVYSAEKAIAKTDELFGTTADGSKANSFQHAYWNVLMMKYIGSVYAEIFATGHENYDGNPWIHKSMDLYNNEQGRFFASGISGLFWKSDNTLVTMTKDLVTNGELRYILFNYEYIHTFIYYDGSVIEPVYARGDFHAYTDGTTPIYLPEIQIDDRRSKPGPIIMPMSVISIEEEDSLNVEEGTLE